MKDLAIRTWLKVTYKPTSISLIKASQENLKLSVVNEWKEEKLKIKKIHLVPWGQDCIHLIFDYPMD